MVRHLLIAALAPALAPVLALILALAAPAPVLAQVAPHWPGASQAERHQWEMDRLRIEADQRAAMAQRQRLETRQTLQRLQDQRDGANTGVMTPVPPPADPAVAVRRHQEMRATVGQIDAWLDRRPD